MGSPADCSGLDALVVAERRVVLEECDAEARLVHAVRVWPGVYEEWPRARVALQLERVGHREHVEADVDGHWHVMPQAEREARAAQRHHLHAANTAHALVSVCCVLSNYSYVD